MMKLMTVSQAAKRIGRSSNWLRGIEATGKVPAAKRDYNGWRVYTNEDIKVIKTILLNEKEDKN